jgi:hypothetical protein
MKRIDARKLRTAIGGGFIIQAEDGQQYITGRDWEWNGSSWMGYPCDENDHIIYHLPAVEVFPVYSAGRVVGYAFKDTRKE